MALFYFKNVSNNFKSSVKSSPTLFKGQIECKVIKQTDESPRKITLWNQKVNVQKFLITFC